MAEHPAQQAAGDGRQYGDGDNCIDAAVFQAGAAAHQEGEGERGATATGKHGDCQHQPVGGGVGQTQATRSLVMLDQTALQTQAERRQYQTDQRQNGE
ncbi:hypothetical protein D3C85_1498370 [compost metagenome]